MKSKTVIITLAALLLLSVAGFAAYKMGVVPLSFIGGNCEDQPLQNINTCAAVRDFDELRSCLGSTQSDEFFKSNGFYIKDGAVWAEACFEQRLGDS